MKNWEKIATLCGLIFFPFLLHAQEREISNRIGVEFGINVLTGKTIVPDRVRTGEFVQGGDIFNNTIDVPYIGIKYERYFLEKRMGFAVGLRFSQYSSAIHGKTGLFFFVPVDNCFLWQFHEEGIYTDYLQITRITQTNNYLGIPLEFSYLLKKGDSFFRPYVKIGVVVNKLISTTNSVAFIDEQMNQYADAVGKQAGKPNAFNACFYPALGFKLRKNRYVWGNIEIQYIPFFIAKITHPFISPDYGTGMQLSLQIPVNQKTK